MLLVEIGACVGMACLLTVGLGLVYGLCWCVEATLKPFVGGKRCRRAP
jgi:hypothetical protein